MNFLQTTTTNSTNSIVNLNKELAEFGLYPFDWMITKKSNKEFKIQHKTESDFFFIGTTITKNGHKRWNSIQLGSL